MIRLALLFVCYFEKTSAFAPARLDDFMELPSSLRNGSIHVFVEDPIIEGSQNIAGILLILCLSLISTMATFLLD